MPELLQVVKDRHLRTLTSLWDRVKGDVPPFRESLETLLDRVNNVRSLKNGPDASEPYTFFFLPARLSQI